MNTSTLAVMGPSEPVPVVQSEATALLSMIERLARDPSMDPDRIERFINMRRDFKREQAEQEFNEAMSRVQGKMHAIAADAHNPQTKSRYASYFALDKVLRPIYSAEGLALSFDEEESPKGQDWIRVVCYVTRGIYTRKYKKDMPADGKGAKGGDVMTRTHASGAASTYGQRYLLRMIFNIAIGEDDDNGSDGRLDRSISTGVSGFPGDRITGDQLAEILKLCKEVNANVANVCRAMKPPVESLAELTPYQFQKAKAKLESMRVPQGDVR